MGKSLALKLYWFKNYLYWFKIPDNMATSQNTTTNYIEIQQQKSKEDFDRAVQEAIRKQMPDILKELREDLRRETIEVISIYI